MHSSGVLFYESPSCAEKPIHNKLCCFLLLSHIAWTQMPKINWSTHYGGSSTDIPFVIKFTTDGGTIAAGYTTSKDGQVGKYPEREY